MDKAAVQSGLSAWQAALDHTRGLSPGSFDQWFSGIQFNSLRPNDVLAPSRRSWELSLTARDEFVRDWVKTHFLPSLLSKLEQQLGLTPPHRIDVRWMISKELVTPVCSRASVSPVPVSLAPVSLAAVSPSSSADAFEVKAATVELRVVSPVSVNRPPSAMSSTTSSSGSIGSSSIGPSSTSSSSVVRSGDFLNPKFTFANFVVGPSNELAYAAALASAGAAGRRYNPLFLCGGTGLGKTHLMHAIADRMLEVRPNACVLYVSAERFTNEFIEALQHHKMEEFRARYRRQCDVLLLDDIQFLAGREQTQEEFFHTFNALHDADKPIVVSSDKYPQDLQRMPERLISRFTSGLVADVQVPALETRVAIVKKKAELEGITLSDEVAVLLAQAIKSNVRELEGALIRLAAKSSLTGRSIDEEFTRSEIVSSLPRQAEVQSVQDIQRIVCSHFRLSNADLLSRDRHKSVAFARQVAMYLCRQRLKCSFPELARAFGNRDHTTVMSAVRRVEALRQTDPQVNAHLEAIAQKLAAEG
ncbi:MAG TPA: chromosomal replication initiator protein DnaA [Polyangiaceae bacterium]|nr:chromosomal replication initiator protein DnaA [Polyangiaceae bacterium]